MQKKHLIALAIVFDWLGLSVLKLCGMPASWIDIFMLPVMTAISAFMLLVMIAYAVVLADLIYTNLILKKANNHHGIA
ncbi:hypothetical protein [Paraburkholderia sp.]|uniref:hypothetical protein n=1 Tax=Paraburkholderia sp. TaxID=1926495 RepID=UPI002D26CA31|nr:hypothetical protein [Paraburkholderia sp.]HZZ06300.1 hypothetical protein [Paraburkholderia sp.]